MSDGTNIFSWRQFNVWWLQCLLQLPPNKFFDAIIVSVGPKSFCDFVNGFSLPQFNIWGHCIASVIANAILDGTYGSRLRKKKLISSGTNRFAWPLGGTNIFSWRQFNLWWYQWFQFRWGVRFTSCVTKTENKDGNALKTSSNASLWSVNYNFQSSIRTLITTSVVRMLTW